MKSYSFRKLKPCILIPLVLLLTACAAGGEQFTQDQPAGFWYGLWHGIISVVSLIIHIFNDSVSVYETNNTGGWYDFGFLIGVISIWGGSSHANGKSTANKKHKKECDEIGEKVEKKIMRKLKKWAEDEDGTDPAGDWDEISEKVEKKLKRKVRDWAEKD